MEFALLWLNGELVLEKTLENQADMLIALLPCFGEDRYQMISIPQVEFGEDPGLLEWTKGRVEKG